MRARRRTAERGGADAAAALAERDQRDAANTLRADDAVDVDTSALEAGEVVERIAALVRERSRVSAEAGLTPPGDQFRIFTPDRTWGIVRAAMESIVRRTFHMRVYGVERVPANGAAVLAVNHIAGIDPILIAAAQPRTIRYMAKAELFTYNAALSVVLRHAGVFAVRRGEGDLEAIRLARQVLRAGHLLGMFVEGTRQDSELIGEVRPGAATIALAESAPIVPCVIQGSIGLKEDLGAPVTVVFGELLQPDLVSGRGRSEQMTGILQAELERLQRFAQSAVRAGRPSRALPPALGARS